MKFTEGTSSPRTALVLSLAVYPGAGQALNRRWGKAVCFGLAFTLALLALIGTVALGLYEFYRALTSLQEPVPLLHALGPAILPFVATVAIYGLAALDAWVDARGRAAAAAPAPAASQAGPAGQASGPAPSQPGHAGQAAPPAPSQATAPASSEPGPAWRPAPTPPPPEAPAPPSPN